MLFAVLGCVQDASRRLKLTAKQAGYLGTAVQEVRKHQGPCLTAAGMAKAPCLAFDVFMYMFQPGAAAAAALHTLLQLMCSTTLHVACLQVYQHSLTLIDVLTNE